ncbi:MAG: Holliday junction branch migration protein RuvA [Anaerolineales bacterium]
MIASIRGTIAQTLDGALVIDVGGIGVLVHTPDALPRSALPGEKTFLHTYLVVREDALTLYGFETAGERDLFHILLGINGVGPRLALTILSTLSPDAVRRAVFNEQAEVFQRVPGIGRKTAQKMLLHLQDRLKPSSGELEGLGSLGDADTEVLDALTALGYSIVEAQAALQRLPKDTPPDVETRLRLVLQSLGV